MVLVIRNQGRTSHIASAAVLAEVVATHRGGFAVIDRVESTSSLADAVVEARSLLDRGLEDKRRYPREAFKRLFTAVVAYAEATAKDELIHRSVVQSVHGLRVYLEVERKRIPNNIPYDADRLETILFAGYDPYFEGDEPPGL